MSPTIKVVQPTGLLDGSKANQVRREINECLEAGAQIVLLDLKDVTFIDSSGLGSLVSALKTVRSSGAKMLICSISDQVRILFELTSMDRVFKVYANREEFEKDLNSNSETSPIDNTKINQTKINKTNSDEKSSLKGKNRLEGRD